MLGTTIRRLWKPLGVGPGGTLGTGPGPKRPGLCMRLDMHVHLLFFFFQKAFRCAVGARHTRHVCCLRFVYLVVLLCKENNNLVKLFFL